MGFTLLLVVGYNDRLSNLAHRASNWVSGSSSNLPAPLTHKEQSEAVMSSHINPIAKYAYWSAASVSSLVSFASFGLFLKHNFAEPQRSTTDFQFAAVWQGVRVLVSIIQIIVHPNFLPPRIMKTREGPQPGRALAQIVHAKGQKGYDAFIFKCNSALRVMIAGGSLYALGTFYSFFANPKGLSGTQTMVGLEVLNVAIWSYVLLFRAHYSARAIRESWGYVRAQATTAPTGK